LGKTPFFASSPGRDRGRPRTPVVRHDDESLAPRGLSEVIVEGDEGKHVGALVARY
jgi:hypothetical protein